MRISGEVSRQTTTIMKNRILSNINQKGLMFIEIIKGIFRFDTSYFSTITKHL